MKQEIIDEEFEKEYTLADYNRWLTIVSSQERSITKITNQIALRLAEALANNDGADPAPVLRHFLGTYKGAKELRLSCIRQAGNLASHIHTMQITGEIDPNTDEFEPDFIQYVDDKIESLRNI